MINCAIVFTSRQLLWLLLFLTVLPSLLSANQCYTIQIWSQKTALLQSGEKMQQGCSQHRRGEYTTCQCGCFATQNDASRALLLYRKTYPSAYMKKVSIKKTSLTSYLGFQTKQKQGDYRQALNENFLQTENEMETFTGLHGLALEGKYEEYTHQQYATKDDEAYAVRNYVDYQYYIKLNFSLFKDGFFEYEKLHRKAKQRNRIFFLNNLSSLLTHTRSEANLFVKQLNNRINYHYYLSLAKLYGERMQQSEKKYRNGMMENYKYTLLRQIYRRYKHYTAIYKKHKKLDMTQERYRLLKMVDHLHLRSMKSILAYAIQHSSNMRLVKAKNALLGESKNYFDTIEVDLYAKQNRIDEIGSFDTMGIEVKLPLARPGVEEERVNRLKQHANTIVAKSFRKNMENKIADLYVTFNDMQQLIDVDREDMCFYRARIEMFQKVKEKMKAKLIAILYEMAYLSNAQNLSKLIREP